MSYNQEKYLRHTLDCILAQKCNYSFEIVIGDDGSSDNSRAIILEYQQRHPGIIKVLPKAPNKGILKNYADVVKACSGKYIAFCHCDDYWHDPLKLEKQVSFLEKNPEFEFVHTDVNVYVEGINKTINAFNSQHQKYIPDGDVFNDFLAGKFFIFTVTACYTRKAIEKYVNYDEFIKEGFMYEDLPTWLSLAKHVKFKYLPDSTSTYRVVENSHSHPEDVKRHFVLLRAQCKMKKYFIKKYRVSKEVEAEYDVLYHQTKFNMAYKWRSYTEAIDSFVFLKEKGMANTKLRLKKIFLRYSFIYSTLKKIKSLYVSKTSPSYM